MVVYHGTPNGEFSVFDSNRIGSTTDDGWLGKGFYFTTEKHIADWYAGHLPNSRVMEAKDHIPEGHDMFAEQPKS